MALEAKNVSFRYEPRLPWVLQTVSLKLERGARTALFAPSGYGKTTLAMLLAGYLQPTAGEVLLDGAPLPKTGVCPVQLICQHPEKAINPRWRLARVLEESGALSDPVLDAFGIERAWLTRYAALAGYEVAIDDFRPFRAGRSQAGDPLTNDACIFAFQVTATVEMARVFRAGQSPAGDALRVWGDPILECVIAWRKPAHAVALITYATTEAAACTV